jgi:phenylacetate-CoA ligase
MEMRQKIPEYMQRIHWPREKIREERKLKLRSIIRVAKERSPWHQERLKNIDPDSINEDELTKLPVMTKADLMRNFDQIVTDNRLTLNTVNEHVSKLVQHDAYLFGDYYAITSGGTSGLRGVYVYDWKGWITCFLSFRHALRSLMDPQNAGGSIAFVLSGLPSHMSAAVTKTFLPRDPNSEAKSQWFPVTLPIEEIIRGLNAMQPTMLNTYGSFLNLLEREARAGRLRISPKGITTGAEPLLPYVREAAEKQWRIPVINYYVSSEGGEYAWGCGKSRGMHLNEDLHIIEFVNERGESVSPGERSSKIYLTNLYNYALPLIRYEITDQVTLLADDSPCPCGSTFRRIDDIQGRLDDAFEYEGGRIVHPLVFYSALGDYPAIVEYQVRQTRRGAEISAVTNGPISLGDVEKEVAKGLDHAGVEGATVSVNRVDKLERMVGTGKLKRFVPLSKNP